MSFFAGLHYRFPNSEVNDICQWVHTYQWMEDYEDPKTIRPHVMLIACTGANAERDKLLLSELGPVAQAIQNRLSQPEFERTSLFPVQSQRLLLILGIHANLIIFDIHRCLLSHCSGPDVAVSCRPN